MDSFMSVYNKRKRTICRLTDAGIALAIWHDGTPKEDGTAVTAATVGSTADTDVTVTVNGGTESRIGASGVLAVSTYNTWQKIVNAINGAKVGIVK